MILTLEETKLFLRIDDGAEDTFIQVLIDAANSYLANATGNTTFDSTNALARLFCLVLISDWFENRLMVGKVSEKVRPTIESILAQLSYCYPEVIV